MTKSKICISKKTTLLFVTLLLIGAIPFFVNIINRNKVTTQSKAATPRSTPPLAATFNQDWQLISQTYGDFNCVSAGTKIYQTWKLRNIGSKELATTYTVNLKTPTTFDSEKWTGSRSFPLSDVTFGGTNSEKDVNVNAEVPRNLKAGVYNLEWEIKDLNGKVLPSSKGSSLHIIVQVGECNYYADMSKVKINNKTSIYYGGKVYDVTKVPNSDYIINGKSVSFQIQNCDANGVCAGVTSYKSGDMGIGPVYKVDYVAVSNLLKSVPGLCLISQLRDKCRGNIQATLLQTTPFGAMSIAANPYGARMGDLTITYVGELSTFSGSAAMQTLKSVSATVLRAQPVVVPMYYMILMGKVFVATWPDGSDGYLESAVAAQYPSENISNTLVGIEAYLASRLNTAVVSYLSRPNRAVLSTIPGAIGLPESGAVLMIETLQNDNGGCHMQMGLREKFLPGWSPLEGNIHSDVRHTLGPCTKEDVKDLLEDILKEINRCIKETLKIIDEVGLKYSDLEALIEIKDWFPKIAIDLVKLIGLL